MDILSIDPGICNWGYAHIKVTIPNKGQPFFKVLRAGLIETAPTKTKHVRRSSDDLCRCREINRAMVAYLDDHPEIAFAIAEIPHGGGKSATALKLLGMATALLVTVPVPLIEVTPEEVKRIITGRRIASKQEMIDWVRVHHPEIHWIGRSQTQPIQKNEHIADAVCAAYAGMATEQFKQIVEIHRRAGMTPVAA